MKHLPANRSELVTQLLAIIDNEVNGPDDLRRVYTTRYDNGLPAPGCLIERIFLDAEGVGPGDGMYAACAALLERSDEQFGSATIYLNNDRYVGGHITKAELRERIAALAPVVT